MNLAIWIVVILVIVIGLVFALLTSVTKWGDNMVGKYTKNDAKDDKNNEKKDREGN